MLIIDWGQVEARYRTGPKEENLPGWNWDVPHSGVKRDYFGGGYSENWA